MKKFVRLLAMLAISLGIIYSSNARSQLLLDQAVSGSVGGGTELGAVARGPLSSETIINNLKLQGYSNITNSHMDEHQYTARNSYGMSVVLTIEPRTGQIISALPQ